MGSTVGDNERAQKDKKSVRYSICQRERKNVINKELSVRGRTASYVNTQTHTPALETSLGS